MNVSFADLWRCYRACRHSKCNTLNALAFAIDAEANLLELQRELREHTYQPGQSICFVTDGPKPREVFAADFRDRIVHHVLVERQARVFEPAFIHDSYACRVGKGTLAASDRLMALQRRVTCNGRRAAWALQLDVASFFGSIDKRILHDIICARIRDPDVQWLTAVVLFHDPTCDYRFRAGSRRSPGPGQPGYPVPARKSLFGKDNRCGLPIGNLTSQFWANVYLDQLDQFVKRRLRCCDYLRYVDDMVLLSTDRDQLCRWRDAIAPFLGERLALHLRPGVAEPRPVGRGVDFVGWRTWPTHRLARRRTLASAAARLARFEHQSVRRAFAGRAWRVELSAARLRPRLGVRRIARPGVLRLPDLAAALASYGGHLRHGAAWRDWQQCLGRHDWAAALLRVDGWRVRPRWAPLGLLQPRSRRTYAAIARAAGHSTLVFTRVGRYVEFFGPQRLLAQHALRLRPVGIRRFGYGLSAGFPTGCEARMVERALRRGHTVLRLAQRDSVTLIGPSPSVGRALS